DLRRHALVVANVADQVLDAADKALAAGLVRLLQRRWIADERVRGRHRARQDAGEETRALPLAPVWRALDDAVDRVAEREIALSRPLIDRMLAPRRVG